MSNALTSRTIVRGNTTTFETLILDLDGSPLTPADPNAYPAVTITDSEGIVIDTGVGASLGNGRWQYQTIIPADAVLSSDNAQYHIDWLLVTTAGRQVQVGENFAVIDSFSLTPNDRAYTHLIMQGQSERLVVKFRAAQSDVRLVLMDGSGQTQDMSTSVQSAAVNGWYAYYVDTPPWTTAGQYLATWTARQSVLAPSQTIVQLLRVPEMSFWFLQPELRMLIDKVQKKAGHVQSYSDSDMYEYFQRGTDLINSVTPVSHWMFAQVASISPLQTFLVAAAAWWGLQAQYLSEAELGFGFSGQTVTLDTEGRAAAYESAIARLNDFINANLPVTKKGLNRQANAGISAGRPISFRQGPYMSKIGTGSAGGADVLFPLGRLGILV